MSYDIPLHIPDNSIEARIIESVMSEDHVTAEQAVLSILRGSARKRNYALEGLGLFANQDTAKVLDEVVTLAYQERRRPIKRKID